MKKYLLIFFTTIFITNYSVAAIDTSECDKITGKLKMGKKIGSETENGRLMFIYQAFMAFKVWHGIEPEINNDVINLLD